MNADYLNELNDAQRAAVVHVDGPSLIIAGPGSGKTRVLTYRIAHMIELGIAPWKILSLTFTNKAAKEMKERISAVVGDKVRYVWSGTFHSIFAKILRIEADKIGFPSTFTIYDSDDTRSVITAIIKDLKLDVKVYKPTLVRSRISHAKSSLISPEAYANDAQTVEKDMLQKRPYIHKIYSRYVARCRNSFAMDFDDLLYQLYWLFEKNPETLAKYRKQFDYVLVDEFQDTNHLQYKILRQLSDYPESKKNISVVGDDAQSIYAFRGATIDNILSFEKDFKGLKIYKLEQNYRSTPHIVEAANELILKNKKQIQKKIWTEKKEGNKIKLIKCLSDVEEGRRVVDQIMEHKNRYHLANKDMVILYRTNAQSRIFEEHLRRNNLPYKVFGGLSFYQRKEVKDALAYFRMVVNSNDDEGLKRSINYPKRGIGGTTMAAISARAAAENTSLWTIIKRGEVPSRAKNQLAEYVALIESFKVRQDTLKAFDLAVYIVQKSKLLAEFKQDDSPEGQGRLENLNALLDGIQEFTESDEIQEGDDFLEEDKSLSSYLQNIALLTDFDTETAQADYISLMSVHAAKGLEFASVFSVGLEEKLFPSIMSYDSKDGMDEERRLFYVAITRAERFLTLSYASSRYRFGQLIYNEPSRFLEELPADSIDGAEGIQPVTRWSQKDTASGVKGSFKPVVGRNRVPMADLDLKGFVASPSESIAQGMQVLHRKFGKGKVVGIDGSRHNRVASIDFDSIGSTKRIMLRFAKLQIVES